MPNTICKTLPAWIWFKPIARTAGHLSKNERRTLVPICKPISHPSSSRRFIDACVYVSHPNYIDIAIYTSQKGRIVSDCVWINKVQVYIQAYLHTYFGNWPHPTVPNIATQPGQGCRHVHEAVLGRCPGCAGCAVARMPNATAIS